MALPSLLIAHGGMAGACSQTTRAIAGLRWAGYWSWYWSWYWFPYRAIGCAPGARRRWPADHSTGPFCRAAASALEAVAIRYHPQAMTKDPALTKIASRLRRSTREIALAVALTLAAAAFLVATLPKTEPEDISPVAAFDGDPH